MLVQPGLIHDARPFLLLVRRGTRVHKRPPAGLVVRDRGREERRRGRAQVVPFPARLVVRGRRFVVARVRARGLGRLQQVGVVGARAVVVVYPWWDGDGLVRVALVLVGGVGAGGGSGSGGGGGGGDSGGWVRGPLSHFWHGGD